MNNIKVFNYSLGYGLDTCNCSAVIPNNTYAANVTVEVYAEYSGFIDWSFFT
jgi:hypothetical protein